MSSTYVRRAPGLLSPLASHTELVTITRTTVAEIRRGMLKILIAKPEW